MSLQLIGPFDCHLVSPPPKNHTSECSVWLRKQNPESFCCGQHCRMLTAVLRGKAKLLPITRKNYGKAKTSEICYFVVYYRDALQ